MNDEPGWQGKPKHPLRDALKLLMGGLEPPDYVRGYDYKDFNGEQHQALQEWVGMNMPPTIYWSTAIGIIDAAEEIVSEAVENGNIPSYESPWRREGRDGNPGYYSTTKSLAKDLGELWGLLKPAMVEVGLTMGIPEPGTNKKMKGLRIPHILVADLTRQARNILNEMSVLKKKLFEG